jgi:hypothetical protein
MELAGRLEKNNVKDRRSTTKNHLKLSWFFSILAKSSTGSKLPTSKDNSQEIDISQEPSTLQNESFQFGRR